MKRYHRLWLFASLFPLLALCEAQTLSTQIIQTGNTPSLIFLQSTLLGHRNDVVHSTTFEYQSNTYLLTSSHDNTAKLWSMSQLLAPGAAPTTVATLSGHGRNVVHSTTFEYQNNTYLLTSSHNNTAKLWSMSQLLAPNAVPTAVATLSGHGGNVVHSTAVEYRNNTYLLTSSWDNTAKLWSMSQLLDATPTVVATLRHENNNYNYVVHSTAVEYLGTTYLLTCSWDNTAKLWSMSQLLAPNATPTATATLEHDGNVVHSTTFEYQNKTYLLTSSQSARLWSMSQLLAPNETPTAVAILPEHRGSVSHSATFEYQGNTYLLTSSGDNTAILWSMSQLLAPDAEPTSVATLWGHDGNVDHSTTFEYQGNTYLLTSSIDKTAMLWSMSQLVAPDTMPTAVATLLGHDDDVVHGIAFEYQDNTYLLTSSHDDTARLWWVTDDTKEVILRMHRHYHATVQVLGLTLTEQCNTEKQALNQSLRMQCNMEILSQSQSLNNQLNTELQTLNQSLIEDGEGLTALEQKVDTLLTMRSAASTPNLIPHLLPLILLPMLSLPDW